MFARVTIRAMSPAVSQPFYRTVLGALGLEPSHCAADALEWDDLAILSADAGHPPTRRLHVAVVATSREAVDGFWRAGTDAGYRDDGAPGERPQYRPDYYGAFLHDPAGNSVEAVHHGDCRRGGHVDHLWIRVADLEATSAWYRRLARHLGLRGGREWDHGRQFRGAWATFSLVGDGQPLTGGLQMSFPAPDRETVDEFHRAAIAAGSRTLAPPAAMPPDARAGRYAAAVLDPAGTIVESVLLR